MRLPGFSIFFHTSFTQYDCLFMPVLRIHSLSTTWSEATTAYSGNSSCCRRTVPCRNGTFRERWLPAPSALAATSSSDRGRTPRYWPCSLSCSKEKDISQGNFRLVADIVQHDGRRREAAPHDHLIHRDRSNHVIILTIVWNPP